MKLAVFEQLKKCSEAAKNNTAQRVGELAETTIEVIEEIESKKANKPQYINITIPIEGWQSDENIYANYYDILLEGITENDRADIIILPKSMDIAVNCAFCPVTETFSGKIRIRAITIPENEIEAEMRIGLVQTVTEVNHKHSAEEITSGVFPIKRGGTEAATAQEALELLGGFSKNGGTIEGDVTITGKVAEGKETIASGTASHAEGYSTTASGNYSHAEGYETKATGEVSHAEGSSTIANGRFSHAEGVNTLANYTRTHAEGYQTVASGLDSHSEGCSTTASGPYSHAEGANTTASGYFSHAEGVDTTASGSYSHAGGYYTRANDYQTAIGKYNVDTTGGTSGGTSGSAFVIGNGIESAKSNCLFAKGTYSSSGADYAEMFEWLDGNINNEDRTGLFVTLKGDKIKIAAPEDDYILGVVSACPSICGNVKNDTWGGMIKTDIFGREIVEEIEVPDEVIEIPDPENPEKTITKIIREAHKELVPVLNPEYDNTQKYIPRSERLEWSAVGLLGKLVVIDDGTCEADSYCKVGECGVATKSDTKTEYRVMKRLDENHIMIFIK